VDPPAANAPAAALASGLDGPTSAGFENLRPAANLNSRSERAAFAKAEPTRAGTLQRHRARHHSQRSAAQEAAGSAGGRSAEHNISPREER